MGKARILLLLPFLLFALAPPAAGPRKLSFKENRELEGLPARIETLEARRQDLHARMSDPGSHRQGAEKISAATGELDQSERDLAAAYARWGELEA
jgi:ATP-binding cassette subfamily F protein uup